MTTHLTAALLAAATTLAVLVVSVAALYLWAPVEWPGGEGGRVVDGGAP